MKNTQGSRSASNTKSRSKGLFRGGILKLIFRILKLALILFFAISILWVLLYRFVNPPVTWLMVSRGFERKSDGKDWKIDKKWIDFDDISDPMKRAAVAAEDDVDFSGALRCDSALPAEDLEALPVDELERVFERSAGPRLLRIPVS